jgi:energy-coupling factor transporter ATP-binding protein EcfA2
MPYSEEFWTEINLAKPKDYLIANSFSLLGNEDMNGVITDSIFFESFHTISCKTIKRLASIIALDKDRKKNTVFISGYRGSGKTTFANFLKNIIEGKISLPSMDDIYNQSISGIEDDIEKKELKKGHDNTLNDILIMLNKELNPGQSDLITKGLISKGLITKEMIPSIITENLKGDVVYINFDLKEGDYANIIKETVISAIKKEVKNIFSNNHYNMIFSELKNIFEKSNTISEMMDKGGLHFRDFNFYICGDAFQKADKWEVIVSEFDKLIILLDVKELLCVLVLLNVLYTVKVSKARHLYYIFDNLDIIQANYPLIAFDIMYSYRNFMINIIKITREIKELGINYNIYTDITFSFVMRETTFAHIMYIDSKYLSNHFQDRIKDISEPLDISADINKEIVIEKKKSFLEGNKEKITNVSLISNIDKFNNVIRNTSIHNKVTGDAFISGSIYPLFNYDYKRTINCFSDICEDDKYIKIIIEHDEMLSKFASSKILDNVKHGARSMLLRLVLDHFRKNNYFTIVGGNPKVFEKYHFTLSRVILTFLYAFQQNHKDNVLVRDANHIRLSDMFKYFQSYFFDNIKNSKELFGDAIWEMFVHKNSHSWNQLITFDSIAATTYDAVMQAIDEDNEDKKEKEAYIRITSAGRRYLCFISVHFEYFACRYVKWSLPLFANENIGYNKKNDKYKFERIIEEVFEHVKQCCWHLHISEEKILAKSECLVRQDMLNEKRFFVNGATHGERIIHQHIEYLEAYRIYLINGPFKDNIARINERMLNMICKYLELMKPCKENCLKVKCFDDCACSARAEKKDGSISGHFSRNSVKLYDELMACVQLIENKNYDDNTTEITRSYYNRL